ncbi:MAG: lipopolysaccharide kinase InaA family protein [Acidobacteriota bacterium]
MRTLKPPAGFVLESSSGGALLRRESLALPGPEALWQALRDAPVHAVSGRGATRRLDVGTLALAARPYRHGGLLGPVRGSSGMGPSRALREIAASDHARRQGVVTPEIVGVLFARGLRLPVLLTRLVAPAVDLLDMADAPSRDRRAAIAAMAGSVARLFAAGIRHADLSLGNFLVANGPQPVVHVLDFDKARVVPCLDRKDKVAMVVRLARSFAKQRARGWTLRPRDGWRFLVELGRRDGDLDPRALRDTLARSFRGHRLLWRASAPQTVRTHRSDRTGPAGDKPRLAGRRPPR